MPGRRWWGWEPSEPEGGKLSAVGCELPGEQGRGAACAPGRRHLQRPTPLLTPPLLVAGRASNCWTSHVRPLGVAGRLTPLPPLRRPSIQGPGGRTEGPVREEAGQAARVAQKSRGDLATECHRRLPGPLQGGRQWERGCSGFFLSFLFFFFLLGCGCAGVLLLFFCFFHFLFLSLFFLDK